MVPNALSLLAFCCHWLELLNKGRAEPGLTMMWNFSKAIMGHKTSTIKLGPRNATLVVFPLLAAVLGKIQSICKFRRDQRGANNSLLLSCLASRRHLFFFTEKIKNSHEKLRYWKKMAVLRPALIHSIQVLPYFLGGNLHFSAITNVRFR